jgi:Ca2+:H+ antiporter
MKETSTQPSLPDRIRSWARTHGGTRPSTNDSNLLPISKPSPANTGTGHAADVPSASLSAHQDKSALSDGPPKTEGNNGGGLPTPATSSQAAGPGPVLTGDAAEPVKKNVAARFWQTFKVIMFYSKLNLLLVFVPVGIIVGKIPGIPPGVIFAMNAIAIIPLAGLLSFATETVARKLGDSLGALLNVTFGNAVELIIL